MKNYTNPPAGSDLIGASGEIPKNKLKKGLALRSKTRVGAGSPRFAFDRVGAGFTLLEIIVVVVILSLLSLVIAQVFFTTMKTNTKTELMKDVKQNGEYAMDAMTRMMQNASSVTGTCVEVGTEPVPTGEITIVDHFGTTLRLMCEDAGTPSVARIASVSGQISEYLTSDSVSLVSDSGDTTCVSTPLQFLCTSVGGVPSTIGIKFRLRQKNTAQSEEESADNQFLSTVTIRN